MAPKYKAPRGTQDVLPEVSWRWQRVEAAFRDICRRYNYAEIRTPLFEETELFARGVGEGTEIVTKQMYTFEDRGGRSLTLRAEGTAPVVRAVLEHNLTAQGQLQKLYYIAPIFRYERPQAGRYRQHHQLGIEVIGDPIPETDARVIALYIEFLDDIGLQGASTHISSIGNANCRPAFQAALREFFAPVIGQMCDFCQARYETNPLRILDCKVPHDVELRQGAPSALDYLCADCRTHFDGVRQTLDALGVSYEVDPTIVRGLDYYTRTAFEVVHPGLGAKDVIMGGGRYDGLVESLGGPPTPGIGFGSGLERLLSAFDAVGSVPRPTRRGDDLAGPPVLDAYIAVAAPAARHLAVELADHLARESIEVEVGPGPRSLSAQMRAAARAKARYAVLIGEDEAAGGFFTLRVMETGEQMRLGREDLVALLLQPLEARALESLAQIRRGRADQGPAVESYQALVSSYSELEERHPTEYGARLAGTLNNLGNALSGTNQLAEASQAYQRAVEEYMKLPEAQLARLRDHIAGTLNNLGNALSGMNQLAEAAQAYQRAVEEFAKLPQSQMAELRSRVADALRRIQVDPRPREGREDKG